MCRCVHVYLVCSFIDMLSWAFRDNHNKIIVIHCRCCRSQIIIVQTFRYWYYCSLRGWFKLWFWWKRTTTPLDDSIGCVVPSMHALLDSPPLDKLREKSTNPRIPCAICVQNLLFGDGKDRERGHFAVFAEIDVARSLRDDDHPLSL